MHLHIKENFFMASANPYIICGALGSTDVGFSDKECFEQAYDTDKYDREFCTQFGADADDDAEDASDYQIRAMQMISNAMEIDNEHGHLSKRKPEFRYLLLLCLRALLQKLRDVKEKALNEIPRDSDEFEKLKLSVRILGALIFIFDHPAGILQFVLVPSHEHFCVYVAEKYVRMKIPAYGLELNIMDITQNENLEVVLQCRHSYTGTLSDVKSKEKEIFRDIQLYNEEKEAHGARQDAISKQVQDKHANVPARAELHALETKLKEKNNEQEMAMHELALLQRDIQSNKNWVAIAQEVAALSVGSNAQKKLLPAALMKINVPSLASLKEQIETRKKLIADLETKAITKQAEIEAMNTAIEELSAEISIAQAAQVQATGAAQGLIEQEEEKRQEQKKMKEAVDHAIWGVHSMKSLGSVLKSVKLPPLPPDSLMGKWVIATKTFMTDGQSKTRINDKSLGVVLLINGAGDANILFEQNLKDPIQGWVLNAHFTNILVLSEDDVRNERDDRDKKVEYLENLYEEFVLKAAAADKPKVKSGGQIPPSAKSEIIDTFANSEHMCRNYFKFAMMSLFSEEEVGVLKTNEQFAYAEEQTTPNPYTRAELLARHTSWYKFDTHIDPKHDHGMWTEICKHLYKEHSPWRELLNQTDNETHSMSVFVRNYAKYVLQLCNIDANTKLTYTYHSTDDTPSLKVRTHLHAMTALKTWELTFEQSSDGSITISYKGHQVPCNSIEDGH